MGRLCMFIYNLDDFYGKSIGEYAISMNPSWDISGGSQNGGTQQPMDFPTKNDHFWVEIGGTTCNYPPPSNSHHQDYFIF